MDNVAETQASLSVIIPVFNEAPTIGRVLERVLCVPYDKQIIVVDDGSADATGDILKHWDLRPEVEIVTHDQNRGKGAAIRTGLARSMGRYTVIQDADLEYSPEDFALLLEPLLSGEADVLYGSRYLVERGEEKAGPLVFRTGVRVLNLCVRMWYGLHLTDEATCYKMFPTNILRAMELECERFEFCPEVTAKACRMGLRIHEVPVHYSPRSKKDGKKIRWRDGIAALATLWKWRHWQRPCVRTDSNALRPHHDGVA